MLALTSVSTHAWGQQIGPTPTNPLDTSAGTVPGTNVPTGGLPTTTATPVVMQPMLPVTAQTSPMLPGVAPLVVPGRTGSNPTGVTQSAAPAGVDRMPELLRPVPGGLTADRAAERALRSAGPSIQIARANLEMARAGAAEAARNMIPQLSTALRYTRLSYYTVPPIMFGNVSVNFITPILDQFDWQTTLTIPITDIPLRILPMYQAANLQADAAELSVESTRAQTGLEAREAFYEYVRAVAQEFLVNQSVTALQRRLEDVLRAVQAGTIARAQQLAIEAQIADLQRLVVVAHMPVVVYETQIRQRLHMRAEEPITIGESLEDLPDVPVSVTDLINRAYSTRTEIVALERQIQAVDRQIAGTRASQFPSIAAVAHADYANPNSRFFPQTQTWQATWDATLNLSWNATTAFAADATVSRLRAQQAMLAGQQAQLREGIELQVRQNYLAAQTAVALARSTGVQLASQQENLRVIRERVNAGAAVVAELVQAENELLRARINAINAIIDARLAVARIHRFTGERETVDQHH
ncbi:MAG: TolC family protein [Deltaproteobacteria bacterium]